MSTPTPAHVRELAARADDLAAAIAALHEELRQGDDAVRRTGFRLDDAAGWARRISSDLQETASELARIAARPADSCAVPWGVCPEHGNTLTSTGGTTTARPTDAAAPGATTATSPRAPIPPPTAWSTPTESRR